MSVTRLWFCYAVPHTHTSAVISGRLFSSMEKTFWLSARVETLSEYYYHCNRPTDCVIIYICIVLFRWKKKGSVKRRTVIIYTAGGLAFSHLNKIYLYTYEGKEEKKCSILCTIASQYSFGKIVRENFYKRLSYVYIIFNLYQLHQRHLYCVRKAAGKNYSRKIKNNFDNNNYMILYYYIIIRIMSCRVFPTELMWWCEWGKKRFKVRAQYILQYRTFEDYWLIVISFSPAALHLFSCTYIRFKRNSGNELIYHLYIYTYYYYCRTKMRYFNIVLEFVLLYYYIMHSSNKSLSFHKQFITVPDIVYKCNTRYCVEFLNSGPAVLCTARVLCTHTHTHSSHVA